MNATLDAAPIASYLLCCLMTMNADWDVHSHNALLLNHARGVNASATSLTALF